MTDGIWITGDYWKNRVTFYHLKKSHAVLLEERWRILTRHTGAKFVREFRYQVIVDPILHGAQNNQKNLIKVARIILSEFKAKAKVIKTVSSGKRTDTEINGIEFRIQKWTFTANWFLKGVLRQFNGERIIYPLGLFSFLLHHVACGILVSQSAVEPKSPTL